MGRHVSTSDPGLSSADPSKYARNADLCEHIAAQCDDPDLKVEWLDMAASWRAAASAARESRQAGPEAHRR